MHSIGLHPLRRFSFRRQSVRRFHFAVESFRRQSTRRQLIPVLRATLRLCLPLNLTKLK